MIMWRRHKIANSFSFTKQIDKDVFEAISVNNVAKKVVRSVINLNHFSDEYTSGRDYLKERFKGLFGRDPKNDHELAVCYVEGWSVWSQDECYDFETEKDLNRILIKLGIVIPTEEEIKSLNESINEYIEPFLKNVKNVHKNFINFRIVVDESEFLTVCEMKDFGKYETRINIKHILEKFPFKNLKYETIEWLVKSIVALHILDMEFNNGSTNFNLKKVKNILTEWNVEFNELALEAAALVSQQLYHFNKAKEFADKSSLKIEDLDEELQK
jgi:hypothetical protein